MNPWEEPVGSSNAAVECPTCDAAGAMTRPRPVEPVNATERAQLQAIRSKQASGVRLTAADRAFLQDLASRSDKGLVTISAGVAFTVRRRPEHLGVQRYMKNSAELNSDRGAIATTEWGVERNFAAGKVKVPVKGDSGGRHGLNPQAEVDIRRAGPARLQVGLEGTVDPSTAPLEALNPGGAGYLKGKVSARQRFMGGEVEAEAYAKVAVNKLSREESDALESRVRLNAADVRDWNDQKHDAMERRDEFMAAHAREAQAEQARAAERRRAADAAQEQARAAAAARNAANRESLARQREAQFQQWLSRQPPEPPPVVREPEPPPPIGTFAWPGA